MLKVYPWAPPYRYLCGTIVTSYRNDVTRPNARGEAEAETERRKQRPRPNILEIKAKTLASRPVCFEALSFLLHQPTMNHIN